MKDAKSSVIGLLMIVFVVTGLGIVLAPRNGKRVPELVTAMTSAYANIIRAVMGDAK